MRVLLVATLLFAAPLHAQPLTSPRVRMVARGELSPSSISDGRDDRALITVKLPGGAARLRSLGFDAQLLAGEVAGVRVTRDELQRLLRIADLGQVEERHILHTLLDQAAQLVGAPAARAATGLDGSGVLIGVVDTGADARHADLRNIFGLSKIEALLDVSIDADSRHSDLGSWGGAIWLRDEIDAALSAEALGATPAVPFTSVDSAGHGTHVAGIATSTGLATGNNLPSGRYVGIAPGANLIIAKATHDQGSFLDVDVLSSCRFAIARAQALGRPLVLNLSLGGQAGGHDGTTNIEQALDALFPTDEPGRVLVVASGNDALTDHHAGGWALDGDVEIPIEMPATSAAGQVTIDLWISAPVDISVTSPSGKRAGPVASGDSASADAGPQGTLHVDHVSAPRSDGRQESGIVLAGVPGGAPGNGTWRIRLHGRAVRWDLWITETPGRLPNARFTDHIDSDDRLAIPGTAHSAISVGSFVSRKGWVTVAGATITRDLEVGAPSLFSAPGPSADGRFVPDLVAPGEFVISSLSAQAHPDQQSSDFFVGGKTPDFAWADDGQHGVLRGTSQAAPFVAGAAALMLQVDPSLTSTQVRELLRASARDGGAGWSPRLGFGMLDVPAALAAVRGHWGSALDPARSSVGVSRDQLPPGESLSTVTVTPRDSNGRPLGAGRKVDITVSAGEPVGPVVDLGLGRYQRVIVAHARRGQVGIVTATVDGAQLTAHPNLYFVVERDEIGRPFHAAGGCSPVGAPSAGGFCLLILATLILRKRSKRRCSPSGRRL